jgi:hypothetical protein
LDSAIRQHKKKPEIFIRYGGVQNTYSIDRLLKRDGGHCLLQLLSATKNGNADHQKKMRASMTSICLH